MLASALFAGAAAGLLAALLHFAFIQPSILLGERYETGELTHFSSGSSPAGMMHTAEASHEGSHENAPSEESSSLMRNGLTVLFLLLVFSAYAMLLIAGFALVENLGFRVGTTQGVLWGIAGFAAFQMAPAMGLSPELPGMIAAELGERQVWWWGTAIATALALALLAYGRGLWRVPVAAVLLATPHIIGAPEPEAFFGLVPPEVSAAFAARVLGAGLATWAMLGWLAGYFWSQPAE